MTDETPSEMARTVVYFQEALNRGRPETPCQCDDCDCELHCIEEDLRCVWCRHGQHLTPQKSLKQRIGLRLHRLCVRLGLLKGRKWQRAREDYDAE